MKKYISTFAALLICAAPLSAQLLMPAPSPTETIIQDFGLGKIELTYSRPGLKGRAAFGENSELVPLGRPWRTGANDATRIHFTDSVEVAGHHLDSGTYVIYTIPHKGDWDIIFSKGTAYPGQQGFSKEDDLFDYKAPVTLQREKIETFTMQFSDLANESCRLHLKWANTDVSLPITTRVKQRIREAVEAALQQDKPPYYQAASFYMDYDKNYQKALEYIDKATAENPKAYYMFLQKARIEKAMGNTSAARQSATKTIELAKEAGNADYVNFAGKLLQQLK